MPSSSLPKRRWMILVIFMIAHGVNDGFMWVIPPLLPAIREHFHLSYTETGALYTLYRALGDVLQAPITYLVYFTPAHTLMAGGMIWSSLGMILASFSLSYGMLAWIFAVSGIGRAPIIPWQPLCSHGLTEGSPSAGPLPST